MMKQIKLSLIPQPGAKPEFLAELALVNDDDDHHPSTSAAIADQHQPQERMMIWNQHLPSEIVLEAYTRESWAWKPSTDHWTATLTVQSVDGRNKLTGFLDYLKQRQKSAYGRFAPTGVFVVSYVQPSGNRSSSGASSRQQIAQMTCRVALDLTKIPKCNLKPATGESSGSHTDQPLRKTQPAAVSTAATATGKGGGFLGKLVGAQQRTNQHVVAARTKPVGDAAAAGTTTTTTGGIDDDDLMITPTTTATMNPPPTALRTSQQVLTQFRQAMQDKMLDFDLHEDEQEMKIELTLSAFTTGLSEQDKAQQRVTMEILKYMVYEAAEEVNEEWIAYKEPSEFMDEVTIAIYKEGAAPPEVLEEINKGELPDEVRGQQRALQEARHRQANQAEVRQKQQVEMDVHRNFDDEADAEEFSALNKNKRDRRTIEDYERERRGDASKQPRT